MLLRSVCILLFAAGCASGPELEAKSPNTQADLADYTGQRKLAPQAAAHADELKAQADKLRATGKQDAAAAAQERAQVAYQRLEVQARAVGAVHRSDSANAQLTEQSKLLAELEKQQEQVEAQTRSLELRLQVAKEAEQRIPLSASSPKRDAARLQAARAIAQEAALLCEAARLLEPQRTALPPLLQQVKELLESSPRVSPATWLSRSLDARTQCLTELTLIRRTPGAPSTGNGADAFLERLAQAFPTALVFRDDRGVVVSAPLPSPKGKLDSAALELLKRLAEVARTNSDTPLFVVARDPAHKSLDISPTADDRRAQLLLAALREAGLDTVPLQITSAFSAAPALAAGSRRDGNDSVEFVFVMRRL
jgi:hypothetical protein